jgi:hypothetical protein
MEGSTPAAVIWLLLKASLVGRIDLPNAGTKCLYQIDLVRAAVVRSI